MPDENNETYATGETYATDGGTAPEQTTWIGPWQQPEPEEESRGGLHPLQTGYLVAGLLALGVAVMWLLTDRGVIETGDGGVAFSALLVTVGAVGVVASLARGFRRR